MNEPRPVQQRMGRGLFLFLERYETLSGDSYWSLFGHLPEKAGSHDSAIPCVSRLPLVRVARLELTASWPPERTIHKQNVTNPYVSRLFITAKSI